MKTKTISKHLALIFIGAFMSYQGQAQSSALSGTAAASNSATPAAGTLGTDNTSVGSGAGQQNSCSLGQGLYNTCVGSAAGIKLSTSYPDKNNTFIGYHSGYTGGNTGDDGACSDNTFVGSLSGYTNYTGGSNTVMGSKAGYLNSIGNSNVCIGSSAGYSNTKDQNCFLGNDAGYYSTAVGISIFGDHGGFYNSTGNYNSIFGYYAGYGVTGNSNSNNSLFGYKAGFGISTGSSNVAMGYGALLSNTTGSYNVAIGEGALNSQTYPENIAVGYHALYSANGQYNVGVGEFTLNSSTGTFGTAMGYGALKTSTTATDNTAVGAYSSYNSTTGDANASFGYQSLKSTTTGGGNTATGFNAGYTNTTGTYNTFVGYAADANAGGLTNATAIGNGAVVTASNAMYLGNASVTVYNDNGIAWSSDGRFKTNVQENVKGLTFIKRLRPVTYNMNTKALDDFRIQNMSDSAKMIHKSGLDFTASMNTVHSGFIAQEVLTAAQSTNFNTTSLVHVPSGNTDNYSLAYAELVVPLVKAVQELNDSLVHVTTKQDSMIKSLQKQIDQIVSTCCPSTGRSMQHGNDNNNNSSISSVKVELSDINAIVLNQNAPNPFAEQTVITYNIREINNSAQMLFYNVKGQLIKSVDIKTVGEGQLNVFANDLSNGMYSYSLVVDGKIIDTKKMIKQ